jgi:hypothetical protein
MKMDFNYYLSLPYPIEVQPIPDEEGTGISWGIFDFTHKVSFGMRKIRSLQTLR